MTLLGMDCQTIPIFLFFAGSGLAGFTIMKWARHDDAPLAPWRWGDQPRRPRADDDGAIGHVIGFALCALVVAYALNNPPCG